MRLHQTTFGTQIGDVLESVKLHVFELLYDYCNAMGGSESIEGIFSPVHWNGDASVQEMRWSDMVCS